jgi:deazaflavin-dependent oxidoreductase (nitroreductase family)
LTSTLKHSDPNKPLSRFARAYAASSTTGIGRFVSRHLCWGLDPILLRLTGGRLASTLVFPTAVLETRGARSGVRRRNAVIYFEDGTDIVIAASNAGATRHPDWYYNIRAQSEVTFGGLPMSAVVVDGEVERARLWSLADRVFPAYALYRETAADAGRSIPLVRLITLERQ